MQIKVKSRCRPQSGRGIGCDPSITREPQNANPLGVIGGGLVWKLVGEAGFEPATT